MSAAVVMAQSRRVVIVASIVAIAGAKQASGGTHQYGDKGQGHAWQRAGSLIVSLADLIP